MARAFPFLLLILAVSGPVWCAQGQQQNEPPPSPGESSSSSSQIPIDEHGEMERPDAMQNAGAANKDIEVGSFYMRKGDEGAAIARFQEAVQLRPKDPKARLLLAEAYEKNGDKTHAAQTYRDYLAAFPKAADADKIEKKIEKLAK